jgi:hypothetical protein
MKNLVDALVTKSFPDVGRGPEKANGNAPLGNGVSAGTNTGTGGDEYHPAEHGGNPQNTVCCETTNPQPGWGVVHGFGSPVTSTRDNERELVPCWPGESREGVSSLERSVNNADGSAGVRAGYNPTTSVPWQSG